MWNAISLVQVLNSFRRVHFLRGQPLHHGHLLKGGVLFIIDTTTKCREGHYSFTRISSLTLDPYFIIVCAKQVGIEYYFWVFSMTRPGIEPRCRRVELSAEGRFIFAITISYDCNNTEIVGQIRFFSLGEATSLGEGKLWIQTC